MQSAYVEWTMNRNDVLAGISDLVRRVAWLEAAEIGRLGQWQIETYNVSLLKGSPRKDDETLKRFEGAYPAPSSLPANRGESAP